jgi:hypothetical protein
MLALELKAPVVTIEFMADPLAIRVDVRRFGVIRHIAEVVSPRLRCCRMWLWGLRRGGMGLWSGGMRRRTVRRDVAATDLAAVSAIVLGGTQSRQGED